MDGKESERAAVTAPTTTTATAVSTHEKVAGTSTATPSTVARGLVACAVVTADAAPCWNRSKIAHDVNEIAATLTACRRRIGPVHFHSTNGTSGNSHIAFKAKAGPINWAKSNLPTSRLVTIDPAANPRAAIRPKPAAPIALPPHLTTRFSRRECPQLTSTTLAVINEAPSEARERTERARSSGCSSLLTGLRPRGLRYQRPSGC